MLFSSWLRNWKRSAPAPRRRPQTSPRQRPSFRPRLEALEDRSLPSTLTVTSLQDSGAGSLRADIAAAQSGDTVAFDAGLAGQTISLTGGELAINKSLTIQGTPGRPEAISSSDIARVLDITGAANVTLDSLVIANGQGAEGAGIYNNGGAVTISNCWLRDNNPNGPNNEFNLWNGGGIYNNGGTVTIRNSTLSNNLAEFTYSSGGGNGGGIYNNGGTVTISDSTLSGNDAYYSGGGIYNNGGTVTVSNSAVRSNFDYYGGGGIYNTASGTVIVEHSSSITWNVGEDVYNLGVVYLDGTSTIGILHGNAAIPFDPNAAAASTITVSGFPSTTTAGVAGNFTVRLKDPYGNIATGYVGTVHFSSSDAKASLPANYTFTAADAGVHTFSATLKTAGTQSITATDTTTASLTGADAGIMVNPAAASQFIITAPSTVSARVAFSLTLTVEDAYGNVVTGYTGTVHFKSTDSTATLPANYTFTAADKGVHTFTRLKLRKKGNQTITLTDTLNSALTGSVIENVV